MTPIARKLEQATAYVRDIAAFDCPLNHDHDEEECPVPFLASCARLARDELQEIADDIERNDGETNAAAPLSAWAEDDGPVLWWRFPIVEPPYAGTPLDDDWPVYMTHWTRIQIPSSPAPEQKL